MSFYELKSTVDAESDAGIIINLSEIESIGCYKFIEENQECWIVRIFMKSKDYWVIRLQSEAEMKNAVKELTGQNFDEMQVAVKNKKDESPLRALKDLLS